MNGWAIFIIILVIALIFGFAGWTIYARLRAQRLGLPPPSLNPFASSTSSNYPSPAPGGIRGWFDTQIRKFKNRNNRSAAGAYEESSYQSTTTRGRGGAGNRLDPDEAWDARVGNEAYYEEQELGLHAPQQHPGYGNHAYGAPSPGFAPAEPERGRSRTRDGGYEGGLGARDTENPFGDDNAASLRGVSPRPYDGGSTGDLGYHSQTQAQKKVDGQGHAGDSPTERRSMFRENM